MVLEHVKRGLNIGIRHMDMTAKQVEKELAPLIKQGKVTAKDARVFGKEVVALGKKNRGKIERVIIEEAGSIIKRMGYVERKEYEALKRKLAVHEKKSKKRK